MTTLTALSEDYSRVEAAIRYLESNALRQPSLAEISAHIGLSEYHFQRLFTRWAGISPKRFLQFLTKENAKALLSRASVLSASIGSGLSSPGRLHDLFVQTEAVTPGEYRSRGLGLEIAYGFHPTPFGECLLGLTARGICFLGFVQSDRSSTLKILVSHWSKASLREAPSQTAPLVTRIFSPQPGEPLNLHLAGTNFQLKVWEALLRLPPDRLATYGELAVHLGGSGLARAVGGAVARNPVAYLIPCHRVLRQVGGFGEYRYGSERKQAILLRESGLLGQAL